MAMTLIKKTDDYRIFQRGDQRYAVQDGTGKPINGEEKVKILLAEELIKVTLPADPVPEVEAAEEVADEEAAADEAAADEVVAEEASEEAPAETEDTPVEEPAAQETEDEPEAKAAEA